MNNVVDVILECPNCDRKFSKLDKTSVTLEVELGDTIQHFHYCSKSCYENKISNIPSTNLDIKYNQQVSEDPDSWKLLLEIKEGELILEEV